MTRIHEWTPSAVSRDEQGIALPLAMLVLAILASLGALFAGLAITEPQISVNFTLSKQALSIADGGLEQTRIQVATNTVPPVAPNPPNWQQAFNGLGVQYSSAAGAADDAVTDWSPTPPVPATNATRIRWSNVPLGGGTFAVTIASVNEAGVAYTALPNPPNEPNQVRLVSTGTVGNGTTVVSTIIYPFILPPGNFPAALSVKNDVRLRGTPDINGNDPTGPDVPGIYATGEVDIGGSADVVGTPYNYMDAIDAPGTNDGRSDPNYFDQPGHTLTSEQLAILKAMAKQNTNCGGANGCYFNSSQAFGALPNGVVFVDTTDGGPITPDNKVSVNVTGTHSPSTTWLIVQGDVRVGGNISIQGLVYAFGTLELRGMGGGSGILGAVVGLSEATVDTEADVTGNARVNFNLAAATTPPLNSLWYYVKAGSWRQIRQ